MERRAIHERLHIVDVRCSKGTYIRTLAEDIGAALGCGGSSSAASQRPPGPYRASRRCLELDGPGGAAAEGIAALDACLLPVDSAVRRHGRRSTLSPDSSPLPAAGATGARAASAHQRGWCGSMASHERLLGVGEILDDGRRGAEATNPWKLNFL
jgi:tRNA pseudouridine55 synthase